MKQSNSRLLVMTAISFGMFAAPVAAQFRVSPQQNRQPTADQLVRISMTSDRMSVGPGDTFRLALIFDIERPWHIYWKNPGDGAMAPDIRIEAPEGFELGTFIWPRPKLIPTPIGDTYCHEGRTAVFIPVTAPSAHADDVVEFHAHVRFAVCDDRMCLFGDARATAHVTAASSESDSSEKTNPRLERFLAHLPQPIGAASNSSIAIEGDVLVFTGPAHGHEEVFFFPHDSPGVRYQKPEVNVDDDRFTVRVPLRINPNNFRGSPPRIGGLVALGKNPDDPSYEGDIALPAR